MIKHQKRPSVVTVPEGASLRGAAELMERHSVGSLIVVDGAGSAVGIVTDRDLCLRAVAFDRDPDQSTVAGAMSTDLRTAPASAEPEEILNEMRSLGVRRMLLVDGDGKPCGMTSVDDELHWLARRFQDLASM